MTLFNILTFVILLNALAVSGNAVLNGDRWGASFGLAVALAAVHELRVLP